MGAVKRALIIGVSDYSNGLSPCEFCENDAKELHRVLESLDYKIQGNHYLVGRVDYESIRKAVIEFLSCSNKIKAKLV